MAAHQSGVWGIDLGQCALKAVRLQNKDGQIVATAFDFIEYPKILSQPDADPDQLTREALEQFLSRNQLKGDMVAISVPGQSGLARFVKLPPVEERKIADIVRFEAKQQIPFPLEEVVWDFQKLSSGEKIGELAMEIEIGLFAIKRDMVNRALQHFKDVNVEVHIVQMAPLALCNYVAFDLLGKGGDALAANPEEPAGGKESCIVALDIGTDNSNLVITDGAKIIWQRPIPLGGNHFTRALTKDMKLTFAKAEHLKRNAAKSPDLKKILASLKTVLNDFVGEVQRSLGYFTNTHRNAEIKYMIGLGNAFRLPGLQKYLQEKLQLEVRKFQTFERVGGDEVKSAPAFTENAMSFGVAYGLSLQGMKQARLQTNLLPHEVRVERIVRGKKPWAVAAAACLLLAVAGLSYSKSIEHSSVNGPEIEAAKKKVLQAEQLVNTNKALFEAEEKKAKDSVTALVRIGAGTKERFNWQLLHQYINMAFPQPNGDRVTELSSKSERVKDKYWTRKPEAAKAYQIFEAKRFQKQDQAVSATKAAEEEEYIKKFLIQINVQGISSLYSDDLGPYFKKIHAEGNRLRGMALPEKQKVDKFVTEDDKDALDKNGLPKDGWVVEIRGYAYHWDEIDFIENTIVENLNFPEKLKDSKGIEVKLTPEMKKLVRDQISYMFIFKLEKVVNPEPGQFKHIGKSYVKALVNGDAGGGGMGGGMGGKMGGPANPMPANIGGDKGMSTQGSGGGGGGDAKPTRDAWRPIGDIALSTFGGDLGGAGGGMDGRGGGMAPPAIGPVAGGNPLQPQKGPAVAAVANRQPRTEFIILFVWREPISTPQVAASTDEKKS